MRLIRFLRYKSEKVESEILFATDHLHKNLRGKSVRGGVATLSAQGFRFALQMCSTAVLARILAPTDYGLVGMTTVVTGFVQLFSDGGLSQATIQKPTITHKQVSTLFWINCCLGLGLMFLAAALAQAIARFYNEPRIIAIMYILSANFLIGSLGIQHRALLIRQMQFSALSKIDAFSMMVGVTSGIVAGLCGVGYWALVINSVSTMVTATISVWVVSPWKPGLPALNSGISDMLKFGGNITGFQTVNYFSRNLDNVLIGRVWGSGALGLYAKAYQILLLPINQINTPVSNVVLPVLSRLQDKPEQYRRYYFKAISLTTAVGMPIVCFSFVTADQIILLFLGENWLGAVPIFRFLAPAALVGTYNVAGGWVYRSLGRADKQFREGMVTSAINSAIFLMSVRGGTLAVAAAYGLTRPLMSACATAYCYSGTSLTLSDFFRAIYGQLISAVVAAIAVWLLSVSLLQATGEVTALLTAALVFTVLYVAIWTLFPSGRELLSELVKTFRDTLSERKQPF